jgi:hydroxyethylthiazole kinase-like uncharacterized protein yjeF
MKILNSSQMREIDRTSIEEIGIPGPVLMENAGIRITNVLRTKFPRLAQEKIIIVAGKGNNGGDGLAVARHLMNLGSRPEVLLLSAKSDVRGDAAINLGIAERMGVPIQEILSSREWDRKKHVLFKAGLILDAIFGTGLLKPAEDLFARAIGDINRARGFKVAVDIPSGLSSDHYELIGPAVKADLTVILAAPKICHIFPPAEEMVGEPVVAGISIPGFLLDDDKFKLELVGENTLAPFFRKRKKDSHKGTYGHLLAIAGSLGKTGAAVMSGRAALKTGAGLVTVATPRTALPSIARSMMELMTEPLAETEEGTISAEALARAVELRKGKDALLLGPGISTNPSTVRFVSGLLARVKGPLVIDADGLNILALKPELLLDLPKPAVLTPHPGEFARLCGLSPKDIFAGKLELAPAFAAKHGVFLVLKGYRTLVASPDGRVFVNPTGNPGMATGGTGDVLSGMIASMIIQEKDVLGSVIAAVYLHGLSGDIASSRTGERALVAGDLIRYLPRAFQCLELH